MSGCSRARSSGPNAPTAATKKRTSYGATFTALAGAALGFSMLQSLIVPAIPLLEKTLGTSTSAATWLLTGYLLSAAIATPILGRVGDMVGKEKMLILVLVVLSAGTLISALSTDFPVMLAGRVVQGAGGAVFPLAFGIIRDEFPPQKVAGAIGMMSALLGVGAGIGIVLAGPIIESLSYHWLYWIPLACSVSSTVAVVVFVPESPIRSQGGVNWSGALLMSGWLVTGLLGVSYGPSWGWGSGSILGLFGATVVLVGCWIRSESRSNSPMVDMKMMRNRSVWTTNLAAVLFGVGMFALFVTVPQFAQTPAHIGYGFGASVTRSGVYLSPFAGAMVLTASLTGRLSRTIGSKKVLTWGAAFAASSYLLLATAHRHPYDVLVAALLLGIGVALGYASMSNLIIEAVPAGQTGVATGMNTNIRNIGGAVGSAVAASLIVSGRLVHGYPSEHGYTLAFSVCGAIMVVAAVAALLIPSSDRPSVVISERHPALTAEAEVVIGPIGYVPED